MNLSCGQCRKIQQFSGEPLRCEVCGWSLNQPTAENSWNPYFKPRENPIRKSLDTLQSFLEKAVKVAVLAGLAIVGLMLLVEWLTPEQDKLAEKYNIAKDKVIIESKPHGCDFDDAPLGNKHCHYEKDVLPMRDCDSCPVKSLYVSWRKVEE